MGSLEIALKVWWTAKKGIVAETHHAEKAITIEGMGRIVNSSEKHWFGESLPMFSFLGTEQKILQSGHWANGTNGFIVESLTIDD